MSDIVFDRTILVFIKRINFFITPLHNTSNSHHLFDCLETATNKISSKNGRKWNRSDRHEIFLTELLDFCKLFQFFFGKVSEFCEFSFSDFSFVS